MDFYVYQDIKYIDYFPKEWLEHWPKSGPVVCADCKVEGMIDTIFVHYCGTCLIQVYKGKRGLPEDFKLYYKRFLNINSYFLA